MNKLLTYLAVVGVTKKLEHDFKVLELVHNGDYQMKKLLNTGGRIYRQGQTKPVRYLRIVSRDTIDMDVSSALQVKDKVQQELKDHINPSDLDAFIGTFGNF